MKRVATALLAIFVGLASAFGQNGSKPAWQTLLDNMAGHRIKAGFVIASIGGNGSYDARGSLLLQGNSFVIRWNGYEIWSDGKTAWTIDRDSREAVVEPFDFDFVQALSESAMKLSSDGRKPLSLSYETADGTLLDVKVPSFEYLPEGNLSDFVFDRKTLDASYVVTDLR